MKLNVKTALIPIILVVLVLALLWFHQASNSLGNQDNTLSYRPTVSSYFIEHMRIKPEEARELEKSGVLFRVSENTTLMGVKGNLYYYGFIDDEESFQNLLETIEDTTPGDDKSIQISGNTIDTNSSFYISYTMSNEEIADTLLNKAIDEENFTRYSYLFMPGGSFVMRTD